MLFDADFSLVNHVSSIVSSCFYHLRDLGRIRKHLSKPVAITMANALISSRLDGVNSMLLGLPDKQLKRLQTIQNILCRIVCRLPRRSHVTSSRKKLHWLPVKFRILFKLNTITYKILNTGYPSYLERFITPYVCTVNTRRSNPAKKVLTELPFKTGVYSSKKHFNSSFAYTAPNSWNGLPLHVRSAPTLAGFRRRLKAHLFALAYSP